MGDIAASLNLDFHFDWFSRYIWSNELHQYQSIFLTHFHACSLLQYSSKPDAGAKTMPCSLPSYVCYVWQQLATNAFFNHKHFLSHIQKKVIEPAVE